MVDILKGFGTGLLVCIGIGAVYFLVKIIPCLVCGFDMDDQISDDKN